MKAEATSMSDDPYKVLGVARGASDDDIKRAYRKLAKELHPDFNPGDKAAEARFKRVSAAYELLGDADQRRRFDRGEIDAQGEPRRHARQARQGQPFGGRRGPAGPAPDVGISDIFAELFGTGQRGPRAGPTFEARGQDMRYTLEVDFLEAVNGTRKRVTLPEGGMLDLVVPEGVADGQTLRLKGKGGPGIGGGEPGDALVEIKVRPHPQFRREGDDILLDLPITIDEAVLGAKVDVPTISGRVQLIIPKGTSSGRILRVKGKGVVNRSTRHTGDQLVTVRIVLPEKIDDQLSYFFAEWRQKHAYDPGRKG